MNVLLSRLAADASLAAAAVLLLKVTLAFAAASVIALLLRRRSAAVRHDLWRSTLLAVLALTLLAPWMPSIELAWLPARAASAAAAREQAPPEQGASTPQTTAGTEAKVAPPTAPPAAAALPAPKLALPPRLPAPRLATLFWMLGGILVLLRCALAHFGLRRLAARALPLDTDEWRAALAEAAARTGVQRPVRLRASAAVATPVTWGARRPIVVLPTAAATWPAEQRRAALLHELAHVARGDYLAQLTGTAACALYWFHPLAWAALRELRREAERACDDRVLASGTSATEYAAQLLEVARGAGALRTAGAPLAIAMARPSTLEGRLLAVLDESVPRRSLPPRARLAASLLAVLALVPFAGLTLAARAQTVAASVAAADTVSSSRPATVSVHATASGGAGVASSAPVVAVAERDDRDWSREAPAADPAQRIAQAVAASPGEELVLDLETGAGVDITSWDEPRVDVRGRLGGRDWRDSRVDVERSAGGVTVHSFSVRRGGSQSTSHRLAVRVPRRFDVSLRSAGGDLAIDGVEGRFEGSTGGGSITLTHLRGSAHLSTGGGTVRVDDCHLDGSVSTGGGPITLSRVSGGLRGSSGSGPVVYREAPGGDEDATGDLDDVQVNPGGGVDLGSADGATSSGSGRLHISRAGGDVRLAAAPDGAKITTGGGSVVVGRSAGFVDASTGGGDIEIGPVAGSVRAGTGAGRVEVTLTDARGEDQSVDITSGNGEVVLVLPAGFDGTIELETAYTENHGVTHITAPWDLQRSTSDWDSSHGTPRRFVRARGIAGSGRGGHVKVRTVNGDVEVRER
ncbi:MAG TPA: M56 family metallopeptidase [Thermoanaerobaculia bacterium]|jgi:beta-lactamase regulating signal transducer with metallopeptidase domain/DUF4097 and DUF4098 domain-containing protein YvlB|nr:M56 family metallopeptidase [Thermoanaerobaculia bacterium]